jgi:hypothetical protein
MIAGLGHTGPRGSVPDIGLNEFFVLNHLPWNTVKEFQKLFRSSTGPRQGMSTPPSMQTALVIANGASLNYACSNLGNLRSSVEITVGRETDENLEQTGCCNGGCWF